MLANKFGHNYARKQKDHTEYETAESALKASSELIYSFYEKHGRVSPVNRSQLEQDTQGQATSLAWLLARTSRISASKASVFVHC